MEKSGSWLWHETILPAVTLTFGMQILRTLPPYLQYLLGDRLNWSSTQMGLAGLLIFASAFLTAWLSRWLGLRRLLLVVAGGLGLVRLGMQVWTGDPVGDLGLMVIGTVLFILFWPTYLALTQWPSNPLEASRRFVLALLLGLALDTALHGLFLTYDFIWQAGLFPLVLTVGLVLAQWAALRAALPGIPAHHVPLEAKLLATLPWLAIGPFLFLQLLVFQNQARLAALIGWELPLVFSWALISHLLGLTAAGWWQPGRVGVVAFGIILLVTLWPWGTSNPTITALALLIGQISAAILVATILRGIGEQTTGRHFPIGTPHQPRGGLRNTAIVHGFSMILALILLFAYYVVFDLQVPYKNDWLLPLAGLIVGVGGIGATTMSALSLKSSPSRSKISSRGGSHAADSRPWELALLQNLDRLRPSGLAMTAPWLLLLLPLFVFLTRPASVPAPLSADPLRVMTYNLHAGFNTNGHLGLETLAQVIEAEQPDLVTLQEVSRGWVVNGSVDMLNWLAHRLQMPYFHFTPTSDALWGIAVLSRYPTITAEDHPLPPRDLPLKRSFTYLQIDVGRTTPLHLINTHFHHVIEDGSIRLAQTETVLNLLTERQVSQFVIITGDLNATPDSTEIQHLYEWGFQDVVIEAKLKPGYTFESDQPYKRLDYILISPDLAATDVGIPPGTASDHLGIAATLEQNHARR